MDCEGVSEEPANYEMIKSTTGVEGGAKCLVSSCVSHRTYTVVKEITHQHLKCKCTFLASGLNG